MWVVGVYCGGGGVGGGGGGVVWVGSGGVVGGGGTTKLGPTSSRTTIRQAYNMYVWSVVDVKTKTDVHLRNRRQ